LPNAKGKSGHLLRTAAALSSPTAAQIGRVGGKQLSVGLFIPTSGAAGIWGPSCRACADLAVAEINRAGGIGGRPISLVIEDAGDDADAAAERASELARENRIQAIVGTHISAIRETLVRSIGGRLPYVYTPLYEGGERTPGVFAIGETPADQLLPAIDWLSRRYRLRRWLLLGNDYVWPRTTHRLAKRYLSSRRADVLGERYLPLGTQQLDDVLAWIAELAPDAILLSLIGQDSVNFNRAFGRAGLADRILRFSCAVEENVLLGIGKDNTDGLFVATGYFANLPTRQNGGFKERYYTLHGEDAPVLNTIGQSVYEGMHFLAAILGRDSGEDWRCLERDLVYGGAREAVFGCDGHSTVPIFLAEARGDSFEIVTRLGAS
jgi:urea transport system substrate-binding protein